MPRYSLLAFGLSFLTAVGAAWGQVEVGLVAGVGNGYSSLSELRLGATDTASITQYGGSSPSVAGGVFVGSAPFVGWGWRVSVLAISRDLNEQYEAFAGAARVASGELADHGVFADVCGQLTYRAQSWWGAALGAGVTSHWLEGRWPALRAPMGVASVTRGFDFATFEARASFFSTRVADRHFRKSTKPRGGPSGRLTHCTASVNVYLPLGRGKWLRRERDKVPVYQPRG